LSLSVSLALVLVTAPPATAPEHFFVGRTEGAGTVQMIWSARTRSATARGPLDKSGALILEQVVEGTGSPPAAAPGGSSAPGRKWVCQDHC
jgi:hypothetical protein